MLDWPELKHKCSACTACDLCKTRNNTVFGVGKDDADILFIGEGPGEQEDLKGEPFVGAAGQLLDDMLSIIDINRNNCYIANVVKCRPPNNRDPLDYEQEACKAFLDNQIALIKPKIIVCLGRIAAQRIIHPRFSITREHGRWIYRDGVWMTAFYHPSALLRELSKRPPTFDELLNLRAKAKEVRADL